ncbi:MAG TPA: dTDP-glucose 4,6-dehydratase [Terriglobales bacterium]|nr:dTDP-glucose 4,6-dehydratase [Terriglobales bacterium]
MQPTILVTGGAGFIGSNFVLQWLDKEAHKVVNLDLLTYAGNRDNLAGALESQRHEFVLGDICDSALLDTLLKRHRPRAVVHLAAESHVDRSIHAPETFVQTNIIGTFRLLQACLEYWRELPPDERMSFRFLHGSTDEVYGSLNPEDPPVTESTAYAPNSPYAASKASSDHLVRSFHQTYGLPTVIVNVSNNYGPRQFPEKLIPLLIVNAVAGKPMPIYGDGLQTREWLYVKDCCEALRAVLAAGSPGESYNVSGGTEVPNIRIAHDIAKILQERRPSQTGYYESLITYVADRPGHDRRYAIDSSKIKLETGWLPTKNIDTGLRETVEWYLTNPEWVQNVTTGKYCTWVPESKAHM